MREILEKTRTTEATFQSIPKQFRTFSPEEYSTFAGAIELAPGIPPLIYEGPLECTEDPEVRMGTIVISGVEDSKGLRFRIEAFPNDSSLGVASYSKEITSFINLWKEMLRRFRNGKFICSFFDANR